MYEDFDAAMKTAGQAFKAVKYIFKGGAAVAHGLSNGKRADKQSIGKIVLQFFLGYLVWGILMGICSLFVATSSNPYSILIFEGVAILALLAWLAYSIYRIVKAVQHNSLVKNYGDILNAPPELVSDTPSGIIFGRVSGKKNFAYIRKPESLDGHVLVVGGVGSGKSSCVAIPSLLAWNQSVFAIDIKGELYAKTKEQRPHIKVFSPLEEASCGYDPFFTLHTSDNIGQDARAIALAIIPSRLKQKTRFG